MAFDFDLYVTGLCAFVPVGSTMRIVLVNARDYKHDGNPVDGVTPNSVIHYPTLAVPAPFFTGQGRRPAFRFRNLTLLPDTTDYFAFPLENDDLEVTPLTPSLIATPSPVPDCPNGTAAEDFGWIARMKDVNEPRMKTAASTDPLNPQLVLARLRFTNAKLYTQGFALDPVAAKNKRIKWTYAANGKALANYTDRPIAELCLAKLSIDDATPPRIVIKSVDGTTESIVLDPTKAAMPRAVLTNLPYPDLFNENPPVTKRDQDHHFHHFYRLANPGTYIPAPRPELYCDGGTAGLGGPKCPPTFFEG